MTHNTLSKYFLLTVFAALMFTVTASHRAHSNELPPPLQNWLSSYNRDALTIVLDAISAPSTLAGSIMASPDKHYQFHWERDAALTIIHLVNYYRTHATAEERELILPKILEWFDFTEFTIEFRGEARWNLDGTRDLGDWGRPQHDGEALSAIALIAASQLLTDENRFAPIRERFYFYHPETSRPSVLKAELESVAEKWGRPSVDVWEEAKGHHFFNRMVQRRALRLGAEYARSVGDFEAAAHYDHHAFMIEGSIKDFFFKNTIIPTLNSEGRFKASNLDTVVLLGFIYGLGPGESFTIRHDDETLEEVSIASPRLARYVDRLEQTFKNIYLINHESTTPGVMFGRYPEDYYISGNPWPLLTFAVAQYYEMTGNSQKRNETLEVLQRYATFFEQVDRNTGAPVSVSNLTWTCSGALAAAAAIR